MFKKKDKNAASIESEKPAAAKTENAAAQMLKPLLHYVITATGLVLVCALVINLYQIRSISQAQLELLSRQHVHDYARSLTQFVNDQVEYLRFLAQRPSVVRAVKSQDPAKLKALETQYSTTYPYAHRLRVIPLSRLGTAALDFPSHRLNAIETDMIIQASKGKTVEPEAYPEGKRKLITILQMVKDEDGSPMGVLLLSLDNKSFDRVMGQLVEGQGRLVLQQKVSRKLLGLFQVGTANEEAPKVTAEFEEMSKWLLQFQASDKLVADSQASATLSWVLLGLATLVVLGHGFWVYRELFSKVDRDLNEVVDYMHQLVGGERALPPALRLQKLTEIGALAYELSQSDGNATGHSATAADKKLKEEIEKKTDGIKAARDPLEDMVEEVDQAAGSQAPMDPIAPGIFRAYDIRGIVGQDLTHNAVFQIGMAVGSASQEVGEPAVIIARDGRHSSPELAQELARGIQASGQDVIDLGLVPTPVLYFATHQLQTRTGVMITGSHNPPEYNGLKVVLAGQTLSDEGIQSIRLRIEEGRLQSGAGEYSATDIRDQYVDYVLGDIAVAQPLKIVIDAGNGAAGEIAPTLFQELGCEVIPLYCDIDGDFPNHHPDPTVEENLKDLIARVKANNADLGIAFDGDGDRVGVVTARGTIIPADRLLMLFAQDVVSRNPGCDVIFDIKCTRHLNDVIASYGGRPIMWKSGHSLIKSKMVETGALLGGEFSGHIFFKERWFGFDDGLYSAARLIEILSTTNPDLDDAMTQFPSPVGTPEIYIEVSDTEKFDVMQRIVDEASFDDGKVSTIDGLRVDLANGWGLVRVSNTTPRLVLRFEAESDADLDSIKQRFKAELARIEPNLDIPF